MNDFYKPEESLKSYLVEKIVEYLNSKISFSRKGKLVVKIIIVCLTIAFIFGIITSKFRDSTVIVCLLMVLIWVYSIFKKNMDSVLKDIDSIRKGEFFIYKTVSTGYKREGEIPGSDDIYVDVCGKDVNFLVPVELERRVEYGETLKFIVIKYNVNDLLLYSYDLEKVFSRYI